MAARTKARRRALDVLFEADQKGRSTPAGLLALLAERREVTVAQGPFPPYAAEIVTGVAEHLPEIDELLSTYSQGWALDRMPVVDRCILRLGTWELLYNDDVPDAVAVDEAVGLATELSTEESPGFVNGLLGRLLELKPTL
ncbi:transcription antitermination factor NusB [Georgenia sp. TF02-10]|uniref:transcription antitermination factor NusB n=1 Tax=Georgenia sp. TF02-10 TaxID=2917725 RepID=UPI001FA70FC0|nr:transcription antitermination factor NusB [Georgenia sp. TF02-10]UNX53228.1 transcription antitermination factor NusB [Georgenia sp. TF02-10]